MRSSRYMNASSGNRELSSGSPVPKQLILGPTGLGISAATIGVSRAAARLGQIKPQKPSSLNLKCWHQHSEHLLNGRTDMGASAARHKLLDPRPGARQVHKEHTCPTKQSGQPPCPSSICHTLCASMSSCREHASVPTSWYREMGMLDPLPGRPGPGVWDEHKVEMFELAGCAARISPNASGPALDLASIGLTWGTYADDYSRRSTATP